MIVGVGIDSIEIERIGKALHRHPESFTARVYTREEMRLANSHAISAPFLAGRWAAKEAVVKALGCGISKDCGFLDIEILPDAAGRPLVRLRGTGARTAQRLGINRFHVSITHNGSMATAVAIAEAIK